MATCPIEHLLHRSLSCPVPRQGEPLPRRMPGIQPRSCRAGAPCIFTVRGLAPRGVSFAQALCPWWCSRLFRKSAVVFGRALCTPHSAQVREDIAFTACLRAVSPCIRGLPFWAIGDSHPRPHSQSCLATGARVRVRRCPERGQTLLLRADDDGLWRVYSYLSPPHLPCIPFLGGAEKDADAHFCTH